MTAEPKRKLKVLHTMTWLARGGGVDNNVLLTIKGLKDDFDFHFAVGTTIDHNDFKHIDGLKIFYLEDLVRPIHPIKDLKAVWALYKIIKREEYDVVHTHEAKASLVTRVAGWLAGCKMVVFGLHGVTFNDPHSNLKRKILVMMEKMTVPFSHHIVSVSKDCLDQYHQEGIGNNIPSTVAYSGIDTSRFLNIDEAAVAAEREKIGIKPDEKVLVNVGRFSFAKAQRYTIEAFAELKKTHPKLKLLFVGFGELKEECEAQCNELGVLDDVIFYGFSDNIPLMLKMADVNVLTSLREGLPRVVVESALSKVPTACFEVEGIHEIINNGESGYIVDQYDVKALTERIDVLLNDDEMRKTFAQRAHEHAMKRWDYNVMNAQLKALYLSAPTAN